LYRDQTSIIPGVASNLNTQFANSGRACRGGILAGCNVTAEGDDLSVRDKREPAADQAIGAVPRKRKSPERQRFSETLDAVAADEVS
jgi:hypothetical protein